MEGENLHDELLKAGTTELPQDGPSDAQEAGKEAARTAQDKKKAKKDLLSLFT